MTLADDLVKNTVEEDLKKVNRDLLRRLEKQKISKNELVEAVYQAAHDASINLALKKVAPPVQRKVSKAKNAEVAVAVIGDWQLAKVTPSYNSEICEQRIEKYASKVIELTEIQRADHPVDELHVWILGDVIEGELIFPGQHWLIDASLYRQVCVDGPRILGNFLRTMLTHFKTVKVTAVIGNHGRLGGRSSRDMSPESNGDRMLYRITQQLLATEERLSWVIPDGPGERNWYAVDTIGNYSALLCHGDQFKGGTSGFPLASVQKKIGGWALGAIPEKFNEVVFGHWHTPTTATLNLVRARCNGSPESHNTYAIEQLGAVGEPSQTLLFVNPSRGIVTAEYTVWIEK
jgi:hypothetical protein